MFLSYSGRVLSVPCDFDNKFSLFVVRGRDKFGPRAIIEQTWKRAIRRCYMSNIKVLSIDTVSEVIPNTRIDYPSHHGVLFRSYLHITTDYFILPHGVYAEGYIEDIT